MAPLAETLGPIAGGCLLTAGAMYPVDVVRALRMASAGGSMDSTLVLVQRFVAAHGVVGLARQGVLPEVVRGTWMRCVQFFCMPLLHQRLTGRPVSQGTVGSKCLAGVLATVPAVLTITPLENAKIALQLDEQKRFGNSMARVLKQLWARSWAAPLIGWQGVQLRQAAWFAPYVCALGPLERGCKGALGDAPGADSLGKAAGGFAAGTLGAALNTPFDVVRTNLQKDGILRASSLERREVLAMAFSLRRYVRVGWQIVDQNGVAAMYRGFAFKAVHLGGSGACLAFFIPLFQRAMGVQSVGIA
mmetsp:Transcript_5773/g.15550  ORF Transcript_5773/g.15550 Transcript_5773/m.15550 type:complete len:303 (-) Transcript_5773:7-915(-)